ncbi:MAG TPA: LysM peptidoglycan-binding domain-containing protein [Candidatus Limnocylindrales bacterium]|nr:LysM peptidoglycan-binding domain-containing protein [Candidatus Limnocylindrales bacterium]
MVRSAAAVLAVLILPSFALAQQEPVGTHTVVDDDTLWDLAQFYYQNPYEWRVIWEANRDSIANPNLIYPTEVFIIPGLPGQAVATVTATAPDTAAAAEPDTFAQPVSEPSGVPADLVQFGFRQARPAEQVRTIFYSDTTGQGGGAGGGGDIPYVAVTRDMVYSAPWLVRPGMELQSTGFIGGFATEGTRASTIRSFDRIVLDMPAPARVGAQLQLFRVVRTIDLVGDVVMPTGLATVESIGGSGVVAVVTKEYQRVQPGDMVRPAPMFTLQPGQYAQDIAGGSEAMVMGVAGRQELNNLGHIAFLDLGSDDGIVIGDEFVLYGAVAGAQEGRLQVVGVTANTASARIVSLVDDVIRQGVIVRLARKMP